MQIRVQVRDYQKIHQANVLIDGLTVLSAGNSAGKSTLFKSLVSLMDQDLTQDKCRHGTSEYVVGVQLIEGDNKTSLVAHRKDKLSISFNQETPKFNLGRGSMASIEPRFPLKRHDFNDTHIFPNIVQQGHIPLFSDISPSDLLSLLYSEVAKVNSKTQDIKKALDKTKAEHQTLIGNLQFAQEAQSEAVQACEQFNQDHPGLLSDYEMFKSLSKTAQKVQELKLASDNLFEPEFSMTEHYANRLESVDSEIRSGVELFCTVEPILEEIQSLDSDINRISESLTSLDIKGWTVSGLSPLLLGTSNIRELDDSISKLNSEIAVLPGFDSKSVELYRLYSEFEFISRPEDIPALELELASYSGFKSSDVALFQSYPAVALLELELLRLGEESSRLQGFKDSDRVLLQGSLTLNSLDKQIEADSLSLTEVQSQRLVLEQELAKDTCPLIIQFGKCLYK